MLRCAAVLFVALAGCVHSPTTVSAADNDEAMRPLVCEGVQQCSEWWRKSQVWVASNAGFKIQTVSDAVIQTYNPSSYSMRWGFQVVREPIGAGKEQIKMSASCGDAPLCKEQRNEVIARFKRYIRGDQ